MSSDDDEFADLRSDDGNALFRLFGTYGRGQRWRFGAGAVASVVRMSLELVPSLMLAVAIDTLFFDTRPFSVTVEGVRLLPASLVPGDEPGQLLLVGAVVAVAYASMAVLSWVNNFLWNAFAQRFQHEVRVDTYDAMQRMETGFFDDRQTGEVMSVLNNDVNQLEGFLTNNLNSLIVIVVRVGGMGAVMVYLQPRLALIPVLAIPLLGHISHKFVSIIHPKYQEVRSAVGKLNSRLENNVGGIETVKAFTTESFETDRVEDASEGYLQSQWDAISTRILYFPTLQATTSAAYASVFFVGGWWVVTGTPPHPFFAPNGGALTAGTLVVFLNYSRRFVYPMRQMGQIINGYQYAQAAAERIVGLLDADPRVADDPDAIQLDRVTGRVEYDDVSFAYENEEASEQVLEDVTFTAEPGEYVGLVGATGAGKSTTMKLLMRFYDPQEGTISVDGTDVQDVSLRSLRESVGYVSQEPYLFYGTVIDNVAYGVPDADEDAVRDACRRAGAHEFVTELEDGYETMVGERGVKLSGGQRQRIALARVILRDPEILILDEATSHVDNETEAVIQRSLDELIADRTTFAIAHRLSTVRDADRILVMDDGRVVERGDHESLLAQDGIYANLWNVQLGEVERLPDDFLDRAARGLRTGESDD